MSADDKPKPNPSDEALDKLRAAIKRDPRTKNDKPKPPKEDS